METMELKMNGFSILDMNEAMEIDGGVDWNAVGMGVTASAGGKIGFAVGTAIAPGVGSAVGALVGAAVGTIVYSLFD